MVLSEFQESLDTDTGKPVLQTEPRGAANVAKEECLQTTTMPLKLLRSGGLISAQSDLHYPNDSDLGNDYVLLCRVTSNVMKTGKCWVKWGFCIDNLMKP